MGTKREAPEATGLALEGSATGLAIDGLLKAIASGDQTALASLYDATHRLVFGLLVRILPDRCAAEETLLDVYTQVWKQAVTYDAGRGAPLAWLMVIARSRAIDRLRAGKSERDHTEPLELVSEASTTDPNPEESAVITERRKIVLRALDELSPEQRDAIELAYYAGMSHGEIASRLDQPLGTVKTRIRLGMMKLRDLLGPVAESAM